MLGSISIVSPNAHSLSIVHNEHNSPIFALSSSEQSFSNKHLKPYGQIDWQIRKALSLLWPCLGTYLLLRLLMTALPALSSLQHKWCFKALKTLCQLRYRCCPSIRNIDIQYQFLSKTWSQRFQAAAALANLEWVAAYFDSRYSWHSTGSNSGPLPWQVGKHSICTTKFDLTKACCRNESQHDTCL